MVIKDINEDLIGRIILLHAKIIYVKQSSGPTLFTLSDGTGEITAKAFIGPGKRAYPELVEGMHIKAELKIGEYDKKIEAQLQSYNTLNEQEIEILKQQIIKIEKSRFKAIECESLVKSDILDKLKNNLRKAATIIRRSIYEKRQIILRHHADCDGYSGAIAVESAILALMKEVDDDPRHIRYNYRRAPSKTPFYELGDSLRDLTYFLDNADRSRKPLVISIDNGGTEDDLTGLRVVNSYGAEIIVIDHHYPGEMDENCNLPVDPYVKANVNPHQVGADFNITAGMLSVELSRMICETGDKIFHLAALSGVSDHSECNEFEEYKKIAKNLGYDNNRLIEIAKTVDYLAFHLRFMESRDVITDIITGDNRISDIVIEDIHSLEKETLIALEHYSKKSHINNIDVTKIDLEKISRRNSYPTPGKITGMLRRPGITMGIAEDYIVFRASKEIKNFNVHYILHELKQKVPHGFIEGGGHAVAGTIKFLKASKEECLKTIEEYLQKVL